VDLDEAQEHWMRDDAYRREWERLDPAFQVARAILKVRVDRGWTQADLAQRLGVSQSYVAKLEGGRNISVRKLGELFRKLGLPWELRLLGSTEAPTENDEVEERVRLERFPIRTRPGVIPIPTEGVG
jgi:transcriptional regulator with XRE-family HTH domain